MIAHLRGKLIFKQPGQAIVECAGVGYDVCISVPTFTALPSLAMERESTRTRVPRPAGPVTLPFQHEAMEAGWQGDFSGAAECAPLAGTYFNMRKTTIYGGSNEVQRNIVSQTVLGA